MKDDDDKEKPELKSIEDYVHPNEKVKASLLNFEKAKQKKQEDNGEPKLRTKFCFKHEEIIVNFSVHNCADEGIHAVFMGYKFHKNIPIIGEGWCEREMENEHVVLSGFEKFLNWIGFGYTLEDKVEMVALRLQQKIKNDINKRYNSKARKMNDRFLL